MKTLVHLIMLFVIVISPMISYATQKKFRFSQDTDSVNFNKKTIITDSLVVISIIAPVNGWSEMVEIFPYHGYSISVSLGDSIFKQNIDPVSDNIFGPFELKCIGISANRYLDSLKFVIGVKKAYFMRYWPKDGVCVRSYFSMGKSDILRFKSMESTPIEFTISIQLPKVEINPEEEIEVTDGVYIIKQGGAKITIPDK